MIRHRVQFARRRLAGYLWLSDWPAMLGWAALVGMLAAFTTMAFHQGMYLVQYLATGTSGSIVAVMSGMSWAGRIIVPVLGGLVAAMVFSQGMYLVQYLATGTSGSIVAVMSDLSWAGRIMFPVLGGLVAGTLLWAAGRTRGVTQSDYMEAVAIGDGRLSMRSGLLRSLSSLVTVASGGSIGREGAMVHLRSEE